MRPRGRSPNDRQLTRRARRLPAEPAPRYSCARISWHVAVRLLSGEVLMNAFLGQVQAFGFGYAPKNWLPCKGQLMRISDNQPLYALLGTVYGGDGRESFALPNIAPIASEGPSYFICIDGEFPPRST
jgi:hypothetical protein